MEYCEIQLYLESNIYEDVDIKIYIREKEICLREYTYEHSPGESYGVLHIVNEKSVQKFLQYIKTGESDDISEIIKQKFFGKDGATKFKSFCDTYFIKYDLYSL